MLAKTPKSIPDHLRQHAEALAITKWGADALKPIGPMLTQLLPLHPACDLHRRWHVVQTEPQQEDEVSKQLKKDCKLDACCPKVKRKIQARLFPRRHRIEERPLLSGYVFVGFDVAYDQWEQIPRLRGVVRLMMFDLRPIPVVDEVIDYLERRAIEESGGKIRPPPIAIAIGIYVRIIQPLSFAGLFGLVTGIDQGHGEIYAEIDIFGQKVALNLKPEQVEVL